MSSLGEFYLENVGRQDSDERFLTGPSSSDSGDSDVTLQRLEFEEEGRGGPNQVWRFKDGMLECAANKKVLDIDWNFAGTAEYSGDGAPVLAWHEQHGGKNQKFYMLRMIRDQDDWVIIGRNADLEKGFNKTTTFLEFSSVDGVTKGKMKSGSLENHSLQQRWRILDVGLDLTKHLKRLYWWEQVEPNGLMPNNALVGGKDGSDDVFICLVEFEGATVIGKTHNGKCYIAYDNQERRVGERFKVLCASDKANIEWVPVSGGEVPKESVKGGEVYGVMEFVGRAKVNDHALTPGRISAVEKCILAPWGGFNRLQNYEALVITTKKEKLYWWESMEPKGTLPEQALVGGKDGIDDVYISLVEFEGETVIGKVHRGTCYIAYDGKERAVNERFKVLCVTPEARVEWVTGSQGDMPDSAVKGGEVAGCLEYVGRGLVNERALTPGRIINKEDDRYLLTSWGGFNRLDTFEVLLVS